VSIPASQEVQDTVVRLRDAGHDWDFIAIRVPRSIRSCQCIYAYVKHKQRIDSCRTPHEITKATNHKPDYSSGNHTGRD
jgi:hypothetical protein